MRCNWIIYFLVTIQIFVWHETYAQQVTEQKMEIETEVPGSNNKDINAISLRYQKLNHPPLRFDAETPFGSRAYLNIGVGVQSLWDAPKSGGVRGVDLYSRMGMGYRLTPLHAIEVGLGYGRSLGVDLSYALNLTNLVKRTNTHNYLDINLISGVSYYNRGVSRELGSRTSLRVQYNPMTNVGFFVEPSLSVYGSVGSNKSRSSSPSYSSMNQYSAISFGVGFRFEDFPELPFPDFVIKTNLLFDAIGVVNIELEIPIRRHFSISGEWIFPWWLSDSKQNAIQVLAGSLELRYWFTPRYGSHASRLSAHHPMEGWFMGVYGGGGYYDLEYNKKGYQGEFFIAAGVSVGYAHTLNRSFSMEYSLGVGYLETDYRYYESRFSNVDDNWHLLRQHNGSYTWIGPTKAKVSLVWRPHFNRRGGVR